MNTLFFGDNLTILREHVGTETVDLIYLDPPFNSKRDYNVLFKAPEGHETGNDAQLTAFEDSWHWGPQAEREYGELLRQPNTRLAELMQALRGFLKENDMLAYLTMMANRLVELHRVLKPTGSLYLHCDPTASHYIKLVLDAVFGNKGFRNEIIWKRTNNPKGSQFKDKKFGVMTDTIFYYTKSNNYCFELDLIRRPLLEEEILTKYSKKDDHGYYLEYPILRSESKGVRPTLVYEYKDFTPPKWGWVVKKENLIKIDERGDLGWRKNGQPFRKYRPHEDRGEPLGNLWADILKIQPNSKEDLGYPTQKPLALLERIVQASSRAGDVVLDPFCGCGTAVHAAQKLGRQWVGIDITHLAISLIEKRLRDAFPGIAFVVEGTPKDAASAENLALRDKYQFQWWACSLVNAQPYGDKKKGADGGTDGLIFFTDEPGKPAKKAIVSVKGGQNVQRTMIADLKNTVAREKAEIGIFITLMPPTREMMKEAAAAGLYDSPLGGGRQVPRIQILTIEGLLNGRERAEILDMGFGALNFKQAKKEAPKEKQGKLLLG